LRIVSGFSDVGWHDLRDSGAYEWWYFDALSDDGNTAFVFIFFAGLPFSPDYLTDHERSRGAEALDHVALFAAVYRHGKQVAYALNRYPRSQFDAARDGLRVRVGPSAIDGSVRGAFVHVDVPLLFGGRLEADVRFRSAAHCEQLDFGPGDASSKHVWNPIAPACRVEGTLRLAPRGGGEATEESFAGTGYEDHNYGSRPLTEGIDRWHWGRAHLGDTTVVFYHNELTGGRAESVLAVVSESAEPFHADWVEFDVTRWGRRILCPRFPREVSLRGAAGDKTVRLDGRVRTILDWGPFYMRFLTDFDCEVGGTVLSGPGISEYLDPRGLRARVLRPLVKTRIRYLK
jgi:carotenoid 1,2-hydratase